MLVYMETILRLSRSRYVSFCLLLILASVLVHFFKQELCNLLCENVSISSKMIFRINSWWQTFMVTCLWIKRPPPSSWAMHFPKTICQGCKCYYWWLNDSWRHLWCEKNCVMLQRGPQRPSTNNSAGVKEPLKPGKQATSLIFLSPSPPPTHGGVFVCLWEST